MTSLAELLLTYKYRNEPDVPFTVGPDEEHFAAWLEARGVQVGGGWPDLAPVLCDDMHTEETWGYDGEAEVDAAKKAGKCPHAVGRDEQGVPCDWHIAQAESLAERGVFVAERGTNPRHLSTNGERTSGGEREDYAICESCQRRFEPVEDQLSGMCATCAPDAPIATSPATEDIMENTELLELAWGIIANAQGGDWEKATPEWKAAAERWRDRYYKTIPATSETPDVP